MSPILALLMSLLLSQAAPTVDAAPEVAPAEPAAVSMDNEYPVPPGAPSDDYGLVSWCYGALSGHMALYDKVIGDVEVIEVEIGKIPGAPPADMESYKAQRAAGKEALKSFSDAMEAAEKASPRPIATYGAESLKKGNSIWIAVRNGDKKYLAREWMSWGLPGRCLPTAARLQARSSLFGQALNYNVKPAAAPAPPPAAEEAAGPADPFAPVAADDAAPASEDTAAPGTEDGGGEVTTEPSEDAPKADAAPGSLEDILPGEANPQDTTSEAAPAEAPRASLRGPL